MTRINIQNLLALGRILRLRALARAPRAGGLCDDCFDVERCVREGKCFGPFTDNTMAG